MPVPLPTKEYDWYGPYPGCDICQKAEAARYDVPLRVGPWGHLCEACARDHGASGAAALGTRLVQRDPEDGNDFPGDDSVYIESDGAYVVTAKTSDPDEALWDEELGDYIGPDGDSV